MKIEYFVLIMMLGSVLSGCVGGSQDDAEPESELEELDDVRFALNMSDLPVCDQQIEGRLYYVQSEESFHVCLDRGWEEIDLIGPKGEVGETGRDGLNGTQGLSFLIKSDTSPSCLNGGKEFWLGLDLNSNGTLEESEVTTNLEVCDGVGRAAHAELQFGCELGQREVRACRLKAGGAG